MGLPLKNIRLDSEVQGVNPLQEPANQLSKEAPYCAMVMMLK